MRVPWVLSFLCLILRAAGEPTLFAVQSPAEQRPYHDGRRKPLEYPGPGRSEVPDANLSEVRIGYFAPADPDHPDGGDLWLAAQLAVEEANQAGGFQGIPFRLVPAWSDNPWRSGAAQLTRAVYNERVWAIVGSFDGPSTHVAEQVVAKARLPLVNPAGVDKSVNCAFVPWVFSCLPSDELQAPVLSGALSDAADGGGCALISVADHDSQSAAADLKRALARRGVPMRLHLQVRVGQPDLASVARQIVESGARVAAVMGDWRESARLVQALRKHGWKGPILAGCAAGRRHFLEAAGPAAEGVVFPWLLAESPRLDRFAGLYRQRFQRIPDYAAIQTYDAVHLVVQAVRAAGLNRARIRDALQKLAPWDGAAGPIVWDALGQNQRPVTLGVVRQGRAALYTTPEQ